MKKIVLILILSAYTLSVTGTGVAFHFCMGKFAGTSFGQSTDKHDKSCGVCGMEKKKSSCCKDQQAYLKLSTDHQSVSYYHLSTPYAEAILPPVYTYEKASITKESAKLFLLSHAPPHSGDPSLHILYCVFFNLG